MSSEDIGKRRRIIQKLDFENCIVTNIKTRAKGRKKLRARISREIADISKEPQLQEKSPSVSPVLTRKIHSKDTKSTSPVLIKNQCRNRGSPVFFKRIKLDFPEISGENMLDSLTVEETSSPGSPVFRTFKKHKLGNTSLSSSQESKSFLERTSVIDAFSNQENSSSGRQNSFQIEDFTQESKQSVNISSVDSTKAKNDYVSNYSVEHHAGDLNTFCQYDGPAELSKSINTRGNPVKKHYKKNSLLSRLQRLHQKKASEKLLWQHQNRKKTTVSLKVLTVSFWKEEFNYFIKCQSILSDFEKTFLIVDSRWVPNVKNIKQNSVLQLHPPWQKLIVEESMMTVLLNVICLDVLDETKEPTEHKRTLESIPTNPFEIDKKLFINSLLFSRGSGFLY